MPSQCPTSGLTPNPSIKRSAYGVPPQAAAYRNVLDRAGHSQVFDIPARKSVERGRVFRVDYPHEQHAPDR